MKSDMKVTFYYIYYIYTGLNFQKNTNTCIQQILLDLSFLDERFKSRVN